LSKERERLAKELEVKNITIERLVNENKNLSTRLTGAQREAEELIRFTKEFTTPMKPKKEETVAPEKVKINVRIYFNIFRICIKVKEERQKYQVQEQEDSIVLGNNYIEKKFCMLRF